MIDTYISTTVHILRPSHIEISGFSVTNVGQVIALKGKITVLQLVYLLAVIICHIMIKTPCSSVWYSEGENVPGVKSKLACSHRKNGHSETSSRCWIGFDYYSAHRLIGCFDNFSFTISTFQAHYIQQMVTLLVLHVLFDYVLLVCLHHISHILLAWSLTRTSGFLAYCIRYSATAKAGAVHHSLHMDFFTVSWLKGI